MLQRVVDTGVAELPRPIPQLTSTEMSQLIKKASKKLPGIHLLSLPIKADRDAPAPGSWRKRAEQLSQELDLPLPYDPKRVSFGAVSDFVIHALRVRAAQDEPPKIVLSDEERWQKPSTAQMALARKHGIKWKGKKRGEVLDELAEAMRRRWKKRKEPEGGAGDGEIGAQTPPHTRSDDTGS